MGSPRTQKRLKPPTEVDGLKARSDLVEQSRELFAQLARWFERFPVKHVLQGFLIVEQFAQHSFPSVGFVRGDSSPSKRCGQLGYELLNGVQTTLDRLRCRSQT